MNSTRDRDLPQRAFAFAVRIVNLCRVLDKEPGVSRILAQQLLRAGTSIGANIEEGQSSQSEADFLTKYSIACKEARETHYWLRLFATVEIFPPERLRDIFQECDELIAILTTIIKKLKERRHA
jgi:four helix bundle protein